LIKQCQIREQMQVRGWDGQPVGKVDKLEGGRIRITNGNSNARNQHQYIDLEAIWSVEGNVLCLDKTAEEAKRQFQQRQSENGGSGSIDL
jgi:hypothetical protein